MSGLAVVAVLYTPGESAVVLSRLQAAGIPAFADNWYIGTLAWHWTVALGGIRVLVPAAELAAASTLLAERGEDRPPPPAFSRYRLLNAAIAIAALLVASVPPPARIQGSYHPPAEGARPLPRNGQTGHDTGG